MSDGKNFRRPKRTPSSVRFDAAGWFFENALDIFIVIDSEGVIQEVNPAWERVTGWLRDQTLDRPVLDFILPESQAEGRATAQRMRKDGFALNCLKVRTKEGGWLWLEGRSRLGPDNEMIGTMRDVTLERDREDELAAARRTRAMLSEAAGIGSWNFEPERGVIEWSHDITVLTGWTQSEIGDPDDFNAKLHPDDVEAARKAFARGALKGIGTSIDHRMITKDGRWLTLRATFRTEPRASGRFALKGISQDVTAMAEARDAALAAGEAKARFLANMSHELRTPMNGVMGVMHLLKKEPMSPDAQRLLAEAAGCGEMLATLLDDVIDFSRIEAGALELTDEPVDVGALLQGVAGLMQAQAAAKDVELRLVGETALGWVRTDPVRLRQALFNLVGNAVKFTLKGSVTILARRLDGDGLSFEIADTGVGIPLEAQAGLFERFHQADASTTRRFGGSGLGLAITRRLAQMMGGDVSFVSIPGQGSTFQLEIVAPACPALAMSEQARGEFLEGLKVLVVEDNPTNRLVATRLLEALGCQVETAADGELGVEAASQGSHDLILMDIQMPGIDGLEATRRIRALTSAAARIPIIALTANVLAHQTQAYRAAGMDGVVGKPISPPVLLGEIARIAGGDGDEAAWVA
ncbi:PAS domain S-box-containing protein [Caulobacter ginsengisoli]|uniref:histidine kinase n=1 Tax=Caulobacter ginsengisoli TaxID=400775 RepID=A0ABU0ITT4_9CAUL|nr:ATP-binding protein [Caulobacter ginsengisoli]MDQ0465414.1 PAS domain S-box-containing protein [Caulobacter ginsengisoli]